MRETFASALAAVLVHEGGFVNDPQDPGGATNHGVTQEVYDGWRRGQRLALRSVKLITDEEVAAIYRRDYWDACRCDELAAGVDYSVFDFAVNSGVKRASRYLQSSVGVTPNGTIGAATLAAANATDPALLINAVCTARQKFLEQLTTFPRFGKGWTRRVAEVEAEAKAMLV